MVAVVTAPLGAPVGGMLVTVLLLVVCASPHSGAGRLFGAELVEGAGAGACRGVGGAGISGSWSIEFNAIGVVVLP